MDIPDDMQRLADWRALCAYLEDRPYNASYEPRCREAYLLSVGTLPRKRFDYVTREYVDDPRAPEVNRFVRFITAERRRLQVIYWASGWGWRLRKDYKEKLDAEEQRLLAAARPAAPRRAGGSG
jgi:hypothetical protein